MLKEGITEPFILGAIDTWGDIHAKVVRDDTARHPEEWRRYKTWRFVPEIGLLMWWEPPDNGEKLTVEDWLERKGYEVKLRDVLGQKYRFEENLKTARGSTIRRYKGNVGKRVGDQLYVHKKYANEVIPNDVLKKAALVLKQKLPTFRFNSIMWDMKSNIIRFDEAPDFDTAREPHVGKYVWVLPNDTVREGHSNSIWHHKWLWVKDDYNGFDVEKSKEWSSIWVSKVPEIAKGTDASFEAQLKKYGLNELEYPLASKEDLTSYEGMAGWKGKIVWMDPGKFLYLAHPLPDEHMSLKSLSNLTNRMEKGLPLDFLMLKIDPERKKVIGHEGRHRARVAQVLGIKKVPVLIWIARDDYPRVPKWGEKEHDFADKAEFDPEWNPDGKKIDLTESYEMGYPAIVDVSKLTKRIKLKELLMTEASQDEAALDFLKKMVQTGPFKGKVFLAGGAVRDMEMGNKPKDLDVVVVGAGLNGGIDFTTWLAQKMGNYKEGSNPVTFPTYGTAKVVLRGEHNGQSLEGMDVEAVASRQEQYVKGSRKPNVEPGTLENDVFRRDFTVNSLVLDLTTDEVLDLTGKGKSDINRGIIRTTSDPDIIFGQDALRMFRAIRFATKYNWELAPEVIEGIKNNLQNLGNTSKERIRDEIDKILQTKNPRKGFELLRDTGLLPYIAQEFQQAVGMSQNIHHKQDVFDHTMSVLQGTNPDLVTRLIALFHDIGKVATRSETPTGVHFYGHEDVGADVAEKIMRDLKYPTELIDAVKLGVRNHMRLKSGGDDANLTDKTLRKFKIALGDQLEKVLDVIHADNVAHADASAMPNQVGKVRQRLKTLDVQVKKPNLPINGEDLKAMGLSPGPIFSQILGAVTDAWYENPNISREEALEIARRTINDKT